MLKSVVLAGMLAIVIWALMATYNVAQTIFTGTALWIAIIPIACAGAFFAVTVTSDLLFRD